MKRILITGAAGFVGHHAMSMITESASSDDLIVGVGRSKWAGSMPDGASFRQVDLLDKAAVLNLLADLRPTAILHLAAMSSVHQSLKEPSETWRTNILSVINLAGAISKHTEFCNVFFVSSGEVYGSSLLRGPADEAVEPKPIGSYSNSKWLGEQVVTDILHGTSARLCILRPFNHVGPGQDERFVVPSLAGQIARIEAGVAQPIISVGNLDVCRDFLPVRDVVRAYTSLISNFCISTKESIFNIASQRPRTIRSVLDDLRRHARVPFDVSIDPARVRPAEVPTAIGDASRIRSVLGWHPVEDWDETLIAVLDHARAKLGICS